MLSVSIRDSDCRRQVSFSAARSEKLRREQEALGNRAALPNRVTSEVTVSGVGMATHLNNSHVRVAAALQIGHTKSPTHFF